MKHLPPNFDTLSPVAQAKVTEGLALAEETDLEVLLVATLNKAAAVGSLPDELAAKVVAVLTLAYVQQSTPRSGAVARKPKR